MECAKDIVLGYMDDILSGRIKAGRYIRLAMQRFQDDINSDTYYVDWNEAQNIYNLGCCLHHYQGDFAGQPFELSPWQLWLATNIFGVKRRSDNTKKYSVSKVSCAKKQGKTMYTVLLLLYATLSEKNSPESYFTATSRDQAKIAYRMLEQLVSQLDPKHKDIKILRNEMRIKDNNGLIRVLSSDSSKADGLNVSFAICDEFEEAESNAMFENLLSATAARGGNSHIAVIGTSGFSKESDDYRMNENCIKILEGEIEDDSVFAALYLVDEDDDVFNDESCWQKSNPNIGVSVDIDFLRKRIKTAKQTPSQEVAILTKNFNVYCDAASVWIPSSVLHDHKFHFDYNKFKENIKKYVVFGGFDLASVSDFTALSLDFYEEGTGKHYFYTKYYLPESALVDSPMKHKYKEWRRQGYLTVTPSNVTDYDYILNDIIRFYQEFSVIWFGYDPYNSSYLIIKATENGVSLEPFGQNLLNFNQPTREIERLIREGNALIDDNPITFYCFANVVLKEDWNNNVKPVKKSSEKTFKIDGTISMLESLGMYLKYYNWTA